MTAQVSVLHYMALLTKEDIDELPESRWHLTGQERLLFDGRYLPVDQWHVGGKAIRAFKERLKEAIMWGHLADDENGLRYISAFADIKINIGESLPSISN